MRCNVIFATVTTTVDAPMNIHPMPSKKIAPISRTAQNIPCAERLRKSLNLALMDVSDSNFFIEKELSFINMFQNS